MTSFVALGMRSEGNALNNGELTVTLLTKMLQHTGRFLSRIYLQLQHPPYSPDLAPADFSPVPRPKSALKGRLFSIVRGTIKNEAEEKKGFHIVASINVSSTFTDSGERAYLQEGTTLKKINRI
jgi:hypothetical protein